MPPARGLKVAVKPFSPSDTPAVVLPWNRRWLIVTLAAFVGQVSDRSTVGLEVL